MAENEKKVVLITGGAMGQGRTHAVAFAKLGYATVLLDLQDPTDEAFSETIRQVEEVGGEALAIKANITSTEDMEAAFAKAWETYVRLDVVVANAGIINFGYTWELDDAKVKAALAVNLEGTWRTDKYAALYMRKQGFGRIINISSVSGLKGTEQLATYCMTKFGIIGLTKTLALEMRNAGLPIYVNAICPTKIRTPMCETQAYVDFVNTTMGKNFQNWEEMFNDEFVNPKGIKFLNPEDVTEMVVWLGTSNEATKFNGREIVVDKGAML
jgi:NAD(P)-dependent dehydrogenase (short-subunit alcohol dehydrogenase family)